MEKQPKSRLKNKGDKIDHQSAHSAASRIQKSEGHDQTSVQLNLKSLNLRDLAIQSRQNNLNQMYFIQDKNLKDQEAEFQWNSDRVKKNLEGVLKSSLYWYVYVAFMVAFTLACIFIEDPLRSRSNFSYYIQIVCHIFFLLCGILRFVEFCSITKTPWIVLEITTSIIGLISYGYQGETGNYLKAVRTLKLFLLIQNLNILNKAAWNIYRILFSLGKILCPAFLFIYIYAVVGLYSFSNYEYNRCRNPDNVMKTSNWTYYSDKFYLCGERQCPIQNGIQLQCLNPIQFGVEPNKKQLKDIAIGQGLMTYQNIFYAVFSTYKQTFTTGSSRQINLYKQVTSSAYVLIYYLSFIYLLSYVYLNIFYGLMIIYQDQDQVKQKQKAIEKQNYPQILILAQPKVNSQLVQQNNKQQKQQVQRQKFRSKKEDHQSLQPNNIKNQNSVVIFKKTLKVIFDSNRQQSNDSHKQVQISNGQLFQDKLNNKKKLFFTYCKIGNLLSFLFCINLVMDFQNQNLQFTYIKNIIDFIYYIFFFFDIAFRAIIVVKIFDQDLSSYDKTEIFICFLCTIGIIYTAAISTNIEDFFLNQNKLSIVLKSLKYIRIMVSVASSQYFRQPKLIVRSTFQALYKIRYFVCLWLFFTLISAIIGFHLFGNRTKLDSHGHLDLVNGKGIPVSFDGIYQSVIFMMLTFYNEQWDYIMFEQYVGSGVLVVIWQIFMISFGMTILSKYLMALLMKELGDMLDKETEIDIKKGSLDDQTQIKSEKHQKKFLQIRPDFGQNSRKSDKNLEAYGLNQIEVENFNEKKKKIVNFAEEMQEVPLSIHDTCIKRTFELLRKFLDGQIYFFIKFAFLALTVIWLIFDHPQVPDNSQAKKILSASNFVISIYFLIDFLVSLTVYGLIQEKDSYLRRSWVNCINTIIVAIELITFTRAGDNNILATLSYIKVLRVFYFLQFRYDNDPNMRLTITAFVKLIPQLLKLILFALLIFGLFGVILVKLYKDDFYGCKNYPQKVTILTKQDCFNWGGDWTQYRMNFSNFPNSLLYLFLLSTTQGWITQMIEAGGVRGPNLQPIPKSNQQIYIFYVIFFFIGNFIIMNVFVGLSIYNFKKIKQQVTGITTLKPIEKEWLSIKTQIYRLHPEILDIAPKNPIRYYCFLFLTSTSYKFTKCMFFLIFTILMSLFQTNMKPKNKELLEIVPYIFSGLVALEMLTNLLGFGIRKDYRSQQIFHLMIVLQALLLVMLNKVLKINEKQAKIAKSILIASLFFHYFTILNEFTFIKKMFNSIITILPRTKNIFMIMITVIFIYTQLGMELFSYLKTNIQLNQFDQNYHSFYHALWALIKFTTLEAPMQHISDAAQGISSGHICFEINTYDDFVKWGQNGCGSKLKSYIFFLSFHIIYSIILLPTFIAIIVDSYSEVKTQEDAVVNKFALAAVRDEWKIYDPQGTGYISYRDFWLFTAKLIRIYKVDKNQIMSSETKQSFLQTLSIPIYQNKQGILCFQFNQVIEALTRVIVFQKKNKSISAKADKMFKQRRSTRSHQLKKSQYDSSHVLTLIILKSGLKAWRNKIQDKKNGFSLFTLKKKQDNSNKQ